MEMFIICTGVTLITVATGLVLGLLGKVLLDAKRGLL